ncbi:MAG: hypothetical protein HY299_14285 [Verrucomicrobia bacterium]|nr:hypothetical protein [Verrucomicrobiota bacterium]
MKTNASKDREMGMAASEFLVVLAVIALACILLFGAFGSRLRGTASQTISALQGVAKPSTPVQLDVTSSTMRDFTSDPGTSNASGGPAGPGKNDNNEHPSDTSAHEGALTEEMWNEFKKDVGNKLIDAARENYAENVNLIFKEAAKDLGMTEEVYAQALKRAASEFAVNGELASVNAMEALQDVSSTLQRAKDASKAVHVFEVLETGAKVAGAAVDIVNFGSEILEASRDPAHQHEHEGRAVGVAAGAVLGAGLISITAPVSVPVLIVGVVGATLLGVLLKPIGGYFGGIADAAQAKRTIVRRD